MMVASHSVEILQLALMKGRFEIVYGHPTRLLSEQLVKDNVSLEKSVHHVGIEPNSVMQIKLL